MKTVFKGKGVQKVTAVLLSALIMLSAFAVLPADLFKATAAAVVDAERYELDFNNNWKFNLGDVDDAQRKGFDDSAWETVELPHDFSITQDFFSSGTEAESGNLPGGTGWYRKMFSMPVEFANKSIILTFDGAYKDTWVYVNGVLVGENHYGYNSFSFDISKYLTCNGKAANFVAVKVANQLPSSRWYSGSGIYRDVTLTVVDKLHVDLYGTYVTTPNLESSNGADGTVNAEITLVNADSQKDVTVKAEILDASGAVVGTAATQDVTVPADQKTEVTLTPSLSNPTLWNSWDNGTPYLYTLRTTVLEDGTAIDIYDTEFGYRWINWDLDGGFSLNGTSLKLDGVCLHHDQGTLGAVQTYDAIYRQVSILKDMGCNSIRTSHGTPSDVFMDVCNELGMLVMNEFFDGWDTAKNSNSNDFSVYFDQVIDTSSNNILNAEEDQMWYEFVLTQSVKRDRNDPAVVIWDVGNELAEGGAEGDFGTIAQNMRALLDVLDPTRPICHGNNQRNVTSGWPYDVEIYMTVTGGNYQSGTWAGMYDEIAALTDAVTGEAGNPFIMSETSSAISSRGNYSSLSTGTYTCSAYDTTYVSWGESAASGLYNTYTNDWFSGTYSWTGFDYIGEPTNWNHTTGNYGVGSPSTSYFGIVDTSGFEKDTYYLYRSIWNSESDTLHIVPGTWDSNELAKNGNYAYVAVYSNAYRIELLGDGEVIGRAQSTTTTTDAGHKYKTWSETAVASDVNTTEFYTNTGKDLYSQFQVNYSNYDTISVKAYDENGNEITDTVGTKEVSNVSATKIVASTWAPATQTYTADGDSYIYVEYEAQDANGNFDATYDGTINIELQGDSAYIVGVDNGLQTDTKRFQQDSVFGGDTTKKTASVDMFNGRALVVLRTNDDSNSSASVMSRASTAVDEAEIVTSAADGLPVNGVTASVVAETGDELIDEFEEIVDQTDVVYEPTLAERFNIIQEEMSKYGGVGEDEGETETPEPVDFVYNEYTSSTSGAPVADGKYVIYNQSYIMTGTAYTNVVSSTTYNGVERASITLTDSTLTTNIANEYTFTLASGTDQYYIQNNEGKYLVINDDNNVTFSDTATTVTVAAEDDGTVIISDGDGCYLDHFTSNADSQYIFSAYTPTGCDAAPGTNNYMTLYSKGAAVGGETTTPTPTEKEYQKYTANTDGVAIENGSYVIYNNDNRYTGAPGILGNTIDSVGIPSVKDLPENDVITTSSAYAYTFTLVDGTTNEYYIQNSEGKYLTIGSTGGTISFSDTATAVTVFVRADGSINIYNPDSMQFLDHYWNGSTQDHYSTWSSTTDVNDVNRIFVLYRDRIESGGVAVPEEKAALYAALQQGLNYTPGMYTTQTYTDLVEAMEAGLAVLEDDSADETAIADATTAITNAIAALEIYRKSFPATLYKYGYTPNETDAEYNAGGNAFNEKTYASMEEIIRADDNLMAQIKTVIGYDDDTIAWGDDTHKEAALNDAVTLYARIYSIAFTGDPVQGASFTQDFEKTSWNVWIKDNTQGTGESGNEGASVQGIYSANLVDGHPGDHASYATLPYGNVCTANSSYNTADGINFTYSIDDTADNDVTIALPALEDISIHINDMFKKENVLINPDDESEGYAKYYWDFEFPVMTTTNEFGVNTYTYDSSSSDYVFQAAYDDDSQTATAQLTQVEDWSVQLSGGKGNGKGFFPFNYQTGATLPSGSSDAESAIYHYAMNFSMDFTLPTSGHYGDGQDVIFNFSGDDDVLVYIDDVLVLDNGGLHAARGASINFTDASVSYQYAMDVTEGTVKSTTENDVTYTYGATNEGISADQLAALQKLDEVRTGGGYHTLSFYYVERGSTESNFMVELNVQEISSNIQLVNQTYAVDFGIPMDYDTTVNDTVVQEAIDNGMDVQHLGITDGNTTVDDIHVFTEPTDVTQEFADTSSALTVNGMKYGDCTINAQGLGTYTPNTINYTGVDYFHSVTKIGNDPTYNEGIDYYVYERVRFIPASTIYFEDSFTGITYTNGTASDGNGVWTTVGDATLFEDAVQAADVVDAVGVNPFGYDPAYDNCSTYSGHSAQMVTVSAANNPRNGGTSPTVKFDFTGTGFDVISMTDSTCGAFTVEVFDDENYSNRVGKSKIVNAYYGYGFGQLYADANGEATLTETDKPLFKSTENEGTRLTPTYYSVDGTTIVDTPTYYAVDGGYTETATYYDADGNLTTEVTETPAYAYAYAYGWVDSDEPVEGIYQVPVIKVTDLDYGKYYVKITPVYSAMQDVKDNGSYSFYMDAIRVYNPAGVGDDAGLDISYGHVYANEGYPAYLQIKEMLVGADSLGVDETHGVIFIDGIAALNNDLETYKKAGPNNELYLAKGQAVAFEVWATGIPDSVQIGASSAQGTATFGVTYGDNTGEKVLNTSTDMFYDVNDLLPVGGKLTWSRTEVDGVTYYKTNTIVLQNNSEEDSVMSISNVKWTFTGVGENGSFQANNVPVVVSLMAKDATVSNAYSMLAFAAETEPGVDTTPDVDVDTTPDVDVDTTPDVDVEDTELTLLQKIIRFFRNIFATIFG